MHDEAFVHVTSHYILDELVAVLERPHIRRLHGLSVAEIGKVRSAVEIRAQVIEGSYVLDDLLRDPKDHPVLACAIEGRADYLVTGDKRDLLPLKHYLGIQIVTPAIFWRILRNV